MAATMMKDWITLLGLATPYLSDTIHKILLVIGLRYEFPLSVSHATKPIACSQLPSLVSTFTHNRRSDGALRLAIPTERRPGNALMVVATTLAVVHLPSSRQRMMSTRCIPVNQVGASIIVNMNSDQR